MNRAPAPIAGDLKKKLTYPTLVTLEAEVSEPGGRTGRDRASFVIHPSRYYVGLKHPWFQKSGEEVELSLLAVTYKGQPLDEAVVTLSAFRRPPDEGSLIYPQPLEKSGSGSRPISLPERQWEMQWEKEIFIDHPEGARLKIGFDQGGHYTLRAAIKDPEGRESISESLLVVQSLGHDQNIDGHPFGPTTLPIRTELETYEAGQTARLILRDSLPPGPAMVTLERDGVLRHWLTELSGSMPVVEIPLTADDAPYVAATVTAIKGRTGSEKLDPLPAPAKGFLNPRPAPGPVSRPEARFGQTFLTVTSPEEKALYLDMALSQPRYKPGQTAKVDITVRDQNGRGVPARVVVTALDERLWNRAALPRSFFMEDSFSPLADHSVGTVDTRSSVLAGYRPVQPPYRPGNKEAALSSLPKPDVFNIHRPDPNQIDLDPELETGLFWLPDGRASESGHLSVSFRLPKDGASCILSVVAVDQEGNFAETHTKIKTH